MVCGDGLLSSGLVGLTRGLDGRMSSSGGRRVELGGAELDGSTSWALTLGLGLVESAY